MNKRSNARHPQPNRSSKRHESTKKQTKNQSFYFLSRFIPKNRKGVFKLVLALVVFVAIGGAIPFPHAFAKTVTVPFTTDNRQSDELELNDSKVTQQGMNGAKVVQVSSLQSLWGHIFGLQPIQQKETTSTVSKPSTSKVVVNGTRKYQYMLCSDGGYLYYDDEQFKDASTGFTSKSGDDCKEKNKGSKVGLSDSKPSDNSTSTVSRPTGTTQPYSYEAEKVDREVAKLNWCIEQDKRIGDEYIGKVQQAQATQGMTNEKFNAIVDPAYWKYSLNIGQLRASGCMISNPYPDFTRQ